MEVVKAKREKLRAIVGLMGASGSGKTLSALLLAKGLVEESHPDIPEDEIWDLVGVVDTEHRRANLYVDDNRTGEYIGEFYKVDIANEFSVDNYVKAIADLRAAGCEVIIIDSISHAWAKEGGLLDLHQKLGGSFSNWKDINPIENKLYHAVFENDVHIIATFRTKQEYQVTPVEKGDGKSSIEIVKMGAKPIQRDDMEYEFMVTLHIDMDSYAKPMKDTTGVFSSKGGRFRITKEDGKELARYLDKGIDVISERKAKHEALVTELRSIMAEDEKANEKLKIWLLKWNKQDIDELDNQILQKLVDSYNLKPEPKEEM